MGWCEYARSHGHCRKFTAESGRWKESDTDETFHLPLGSLAFASDRSRPGTYVRGREPPASSLAGFFTRPPAAVRPLACPAAVRARPASLRGHGLSGFRGFPRRLFPGSAAGGSGFRAHRRSLFLSAEHVLELWQLRRRVERRVPTVGHVRWGVLHLSLQ